MSLRMNRPEISKYMVRVYKLPRQPQVNYRLKARDPPYCAFITNGKMAAPQDMSKYSLENLASKVAGFIAKANREKENHTIFHYVARFRESVPAHLQGKGLPLTDEEWAQFIRDVHHDLHSLTHSDNKRTLRC
jgi:hypothetical protein